MPAKKSRGSGRFHRRLAEITAATILVAVNVSLGIVPVASTIAIGGSPSPYSLVLICTTAFAVVLLLLLLVRSPAPAVERVSAVGSTLSLSLEGGSTLEIVLGGQDSHIAVRAFREWPSQDGRSNTRFLIDGPGFRGARASEDVVRSLIAVAKGRGIPVREVPGNRLNRLEWTRLDIGVK